MAKVQVCDKCGVEIKRTSLFDDSFGDEFDDVIKEGVEDFLPPRKRIIYPELCPKCSPKFDSLIDKFNKEIKNFLSEK